MLATMLIGYLYFIIFVINIAINFILFYTIVLYSEIYMLLHYKYNISILT